MASLQVWVKLNFIIIIINLGCLFFHVLLEPIAEGLTYQDLQSYARTLLASTAESKARSSNGIRDPAVFHAGEDQGQGMDGVSGCREAVEILTRNPKKRECLFIPKFERFAFTSTSSPYRSRCGLRKELSWNRNGLRHRQEFTFRLRPIENGGPCARL